MSFSPMSFPPHMAGNIAGGLYIITPAINTMQNTTMHHQQHDCSQANDIKFTIESIRQSG